MNSLNTLYISPSIDFVIIVIVSLLIILVNSKYLSNMKEESKNAQVIQDVMIARTKLAMVAAPFIVLIGLTSLFSVLVLKLLAMIST